MSMEAGFIDAESKALNGFGRRFMFFWFGQSLEPGYVPFAVQDGFVQPVAGDLGELRIGLVTSTLR